MANKRRNKNEPTKGDKLAQAYRNRAAMLRVFESAVLAASGFSSNVIRATYWNPVEFNERMGMYDRVY